MAKRNKRSRENEFLREIGEDVHFEKDRRRQRMNHEKDRRDYDEFDDGECDWD